MIHYDPPLLDRSRLVALVETISACASAVRAPPDLDAPCCYDPGFAEDIAEVAEIARLTVERVAALHRTAEYRPMYGFAPGFAYLGGLPAELAICASEAAAPAERASDRRRSRGGDLPMPTGWYVLARTPERLFSRAGTRIS